ncbi:hypothetical protein DAETH_42790 (plasmid) [Deinococcus aetherius]|uniref:Uncharacterized protein n=1 Tax=Deinococcus aetherius TaxID=200252 RepID=A0ABM8AKG1_9DEIO|nr:hypothetical protein [Deinococcus aetherius]BDP44310.1 hypothetical protein DAETH_42790 [Deinococcus aetherius]
MTRPAQPKPLKVPPPRVEEVRLELAAERQALPVIGRPSLDFGDR